VSPIGLDLGDEEEPAGPRPSELIIPDDYLSNSRVAKYLRCGEDYRRTYVDGHRWKGNAATSVGRSVHSLVENTLRELVRTGKLRTLEEGLDEAPGITVGILEGTELVGDEKDVSEDEYVTRVRKAYEAWHRIRAPEIVPLAIEESFDQRLNGIRVKGIIDLIDVGTGIKTVVDLKITKRKKSEREAKNSLQLTIYSAVTGIPTVGFDAVVNKKAGTEVHPVRATLTQGDMAWAGTLVRNVAENISRGAFPLASPEEWWCTEKFCSHWAECRGR
jgi:RecB family exonuclease